MVKENLGISFCYFCPLSFVFMVVDGAFPFSRRCEKVTQSSRYIQSCTQGGKGKASSGPAAPYWGVYYRLSLCFYTTTSQYYLLYRMKGGNVKSCNI